VSTKNAGWVRVSREQPGPAVRTRHRAPVQQGSRAAACLLGLPGERSHRPSTAAGAAAEGLARSHRRPPLHVRMPGLMAICLYGMTLTAHTRRLCLPRATPRPTRGGLHRRVCIFTAISQGPPTYHAWICMAHGRFERTIGQKLTLFESYVLNPPTVNQLRDPNTNFRIELGLR